MLRSEAPKYLIDTSTSFRYPQDDRWNMIFFAKVSIQDYTKYSFISNSVGVVRTFGMEIR